jgi:hypothetical protein
MHDQRMNNDIMLVVLMSDDSRACGVWRSLDGFDPYDCYRGKGWSAEDGEPYEKEGVLLPHCSSQRSNVAEQKGDARVPRPHWQVD